MYPSHIVVNQLSLYLSLATCLSTCLSNPLRRFLAFIPIITNTRAFQKPRRDPVNPTEMRRGKLRKSGLMKEAMRLVDGVTQIDSNTTKIMSGMRMYCRKDRDGRSAALMVGVRSETKVLGGTGQRESNGADGQRRRTGSRSR